MHARTDIQSTQALTYERVCEVTDIHFCKDPFVVQMCSCWMVFLSGSCVFLQVVFEAHAEGHRHYTLALLLSPFSYTTTAVVVKAHD